MYFVAPSVYLPRPQYLFQNVKSFRSRQAIDHGIVKGVLAKYGLEVIKPPKVPSGGGRSQSLIIDTTAGKKLLKRYKESLAHSTITQEHSILNYLAEIDFPAPRLVADNTDHTLVQQGEERYALFDFIEGGFQYHNYILFPGQARYFITNASEMVARLHDNLKDFVPQGYNPDGFKSQSEDRWRNLEWILNRLAQCVTETTRLKPASDTSQLAWLLQQAGYLEEALIQLDAKLKGAALPRQLIHADYGPYNLLFRKNASAIIIDFEIARLDWRVTEIIQAWHKFCYNIFGFRLHKMKWFLDAYQLYLPLTQDELYFIPVVWQYLDIRWAIMNWSRYCQSEADSLLVSARKILDQADWITNNGDKLISSVLA
jgi:Ser/Thr protein kinase RdoA (MazF antagonist)